MVTNNNSVKLKSQFKKTYTKPISERNFRTFTDVPMSKQLRINVLRLLSPTSDWPM